MGGFGAKRPLTGAKWERQPAGFKWLDGTIGAGEPRLAQDVKLAARYMARRGLAADTGAINLADYGATA